MRISVVNLTHGLLSDTEVLTAIRAINRQIAEDFAPYWNASGVLRLEGSSGGTPDYDKAEEMQGEGILYLWDKADVPNAVGYHEANHRGIPFGFVFVDVAYEMGENWTVTFSHEALELIGDRQAHLLVRGPDPRDRRRRVYFWHEMCDAVQDEKYAIDGIEVSNFVLPLYFTEGAETGSRNDFLGTRYRMLGSREERSLESFGINPGGYVGFYDPETGEHVSLLGPDRKDPADGAVDPESRKRAGHRRRRKNKARMARRGNRYQEMGEPPRGEERTVRRNAATKLSAGGVEISIHSEKTALRVVVDIPPLASACHQGRGYFAHDIYSDARKVHDDLADTGFEELTAFEIEAREETGAGSQAAADVRVGHEEGEALVALVDVDGVLFFCEPRRATRRSTHFRIPVRTAGAGMDSRRASLLGAGRSIVRVLRHKLLDAIKDEIAADLAGFLARTIEKTAFRKPREAALQRLELVDSVLDKRIGRIVDHTGKLAPDKKYLLLIHGIFSSVEGTFNELLLDRYGDELLARLRPAYHQIVGFDHWTVARSTLENAEALLALLPDRCRIDIVCHSRGAGVTRCLLEHPKLAGRLAKRGIRVGKVVFVAGACQGSPLAGPEQLTPLLNVFAALRSVAGEYLPLALATGLLRAAQYGLRVFPGIASMAPGSPILRELNKPVNQKGCEYITMRSDYEPRGKLAEMLDEAGIDRVVFRGARNDGVVPFDGAATFDPKIAKTVLVTAGPEFDADTPEAVYHTAFFEQREVRTALLEHLAPEA